MHEIINLGPMHFEHVSPCFKDRLEYVILYTLLPGIDSCNYWLLAMRKESKYYQQRVLASVISIESRHCWAVLMWIQSKYQ